MRYFTSLCSGSILQIRLIYIVDWGELVVDADGTFEKGPVRIMDIREQVLHGKTLRLVKVLCSTEESRR